jgi:hypothetical protein
MGVRANRVIGTIAAIAGGLALVRLADAVGKRELVRAAQELAVQVDTLKTTSDRLEATKERLTRDEQFFNLRIAALARKEPYLVITREEQKLVLALEDKTVLETGYRLRGPAAARDGFAVLPMGTLEVLAEDTVTDWRKPDWLYRLEGEALPPDSARVVHHAFGPGEVFLGGDIVIHGPAVEGVPPEAVDHSYIELDVTALRVVLDAVKPGTLVLIR